MALPFAYIASFCVCCSPRPLPQAQVVALEKLVSERTDNPILCDRILWQLERSCVSEQAMLLQQTPRSVEAADVLPLPAPQCRLVQDLALEVAAVAKTLLLQRSVASERSAFTDVEPRSRVENEIRLLAYKATWHKPALLELDSLVMFVNELMKQSPTPLVCPTLLRRSLLGSLRRAAFLQLAVMYRETIPYPVRDTDAITTFVEMLGYNDEHVQRIFDMSKHQFGTVLYVLYLTSCMHACMLLHKR